MIRRTIAATVVAASLLFAPAAQAHHRTVVETPVVQLTDSGCRDGQPIASWYASTGESGTFTTETTRVRVKADRGVWFDDGRKVVNVKVTNNTFNEACTAS